MRSGPMDLFTRSPVRPYRSLLLAALIGLPSGVVAVSLGHALTEATSLPQFLLRVADALPVSLLTYPLMGLLVLFYGMPLLWLALRFRKAGPATALLVVLLPGIGLGWSGDSLGWTVVAISVATGLVFVLLAYRGSPGDPAADPHPGSG